MTLLAEVADERPILRDEVRRVQVGCGPHHHRAGWWNTDLRPFAGIDEAMDACAPWPWHEQLDYVYAEHFLEHLTFENAMSFLLEAGRALRVGGRIRLTTPSLEWVIKTHVVFGPDGAMPVYDTLRLNRAFHGWGHAFLYSAPMLRTTFEKIGYVDVTFCDYGRSDDPALCDLELHGDFSVDHGYPSVWIVEATKPESGIAIDGVFHAFVDDALGQYLRGGH